VGYLRKIDNSPYWHAVFLDAHGEEVQRSTKTTNKQTAANILNHWTTTATLLRDKALCSHRVRNVVNELSKLTAGDSARVVTARAYSRSFLVSVKSSEVQPTYNNYRSALRLFAKFMADRMTMPLDDITKPIIAAFRDHLLETGNKPESVQQRIEVLHVMFADAIDDGVIKHNPCDGVQVRIPKHRMPTMTKKRKALNYQEGVSLVDNATPEELAAVVLGLDLGPRCGDALGVEASNINLQTGRIKFWVEKADRWHIVDLFPSTLLFFIEYIGHHWTNTSANLLLPTLGTDAGPEIDQKTRLSNVGRGFDAMRKLFDRSGLGEWVTRPSGDRFNTAAYHCFRITNDNALKMAGVSTEWVMWRLCQKSKKANEAYDRFSPENGRKAIFGKLGLLVGATHDDEEEKLMLDGSMTFDDMMKVIDYAREKLLMIRSHGRGSSK